MADYDTGKTSTFGRELMNYISSKMPYSGLNVADLTDTLNPKYKYFENTGLRRAEVLSRHSISQNFDYNNASIGNITADKRYGEIMYANIQKDKLARVRDYRIMAAFSEVANALDEICDEVITIDSNTNSCMNLKYKNISLSNFQMETLQKEFLKYTTYFDFEHKGWSYFRQLLVEGEIYWEHIMHKDYPEEGILGVVQVPTELVDPVFSNVQNVMVKGYLYRKPKFDPNNPLKQVGIDYVPLDKNQVTYVNSDVWNESKTMRLPFLENARRAYRQLSMIEDSIVIYRLARAPERLVFDVDVGNMPAPKAEAYLRKLITQYWASKTYDPSQGGIVQKFNPQSILDNFWFAKRAGSEGTKVTQLAGACLAMDTKIPLLDGRTLTIAEIEQEIKDNKKIWVYSTDPKTGHIAPGEVTWAGVTQEESEVYKLVFDNGKELVCTPDHKFPILGKGFVEAKDLEIGESMIPFYTQQSKLGNNNYEMVYQNDVKSWEYTHRMVGKFFKNKNIHEEFIYSEKYVNDEKQVIHHKDFNRYNNNPDNLAYMNAKDHIILHKDQKFEPMVGTKASVERLKWLKENDIEKYEEFCRKLSNNTKLMWASMTENEKSVHCNKISSNIKNYFDNLSEEEKEIRASISRQNRKIGNQKLIEKLKDSEFKKKYGSSISKGLKQKFSSMTEEERNEHFNKSYEKNLRSEIYVKNLKNLTQNQSLIFDDKILKFVIDQVRGKTTHEITKHDLCDIINNTPEILNHFLKINENRNVKNWCGTKISHTHFAPMVKNFGYQTWKQFRKECELFNHRLVKVEKLPNKIQVGTLTIDNEERYHNYHTFALDCGVFTKNSNLGELQDLMYFVKKLYQSLKVPTTRLDPQDAFRDGSDMLREELKFARFIIRLQQLFSNAIKNGFITHLQMRGLWSEFELKEETLLVEFNVPTNFYELRESQKLEMKVSNFGSLAANETISPSFAQKRYLGWSDIDVKANREFLRKDKEFKWELMQIETLGPKWKELLAAQAEAGGAAGAEGGGEMGGAGGGGGGGGGGGLPPAFGGPAATGEAPPAGGAEGEEAPPESGAAPEAGAPPAGGTPE